MKIVKISNGEVTLKDFCSRKLRKEINQSMFANISGDTEGKIQGLNMVDIDKANDVALLGMIEKIVIDGKEHLPDLKVLDEMNSKDVDLILDEINKVTKTSVPNE